jgi:hypothetical protein
MLIFGYSYRHYIKTGRRRAAWIISGTNLHFRLTSLRQEARMTPMLFPFLWKVHYNKYEFINFQTGLPSRLIHISSPSNTLVKPCHHSPVKALGWTWNFPISSATFIVTTTYCDFLVKHRCLLKIEIWTLQYISESSDRHRKLPQPYSIQTQLCSRDREMCSEHCVLSSLSWMEVNQNEWPWRSWSG